MKNRREVVSMGAAAMGVALAPHALAAVASATAHAPVRGSARPKSGPDTMHDKKGDARMRIICLEEHVHDPAVAAVVTGTLINEAPYFKDIGSRYRDDPSREPADRPRLTFIPESTKTAAGPLSERIKAMDAERIDYQVLSLSNAPQLASGPAAVQMIREANDRIARAVAEHPDRFSAFFSLPWQDTEAAVREAERCVRELKLPAVLLTGRPGGLEFIDHARFEPILAKLAELDAPIYIHPGPPHPAVQQAYYAGFNPELTARFSLFGWGWHHEAGIQVIRLILAGTLDRHRGLKIISGHWGEMVPFYLQRMDDTMPQAVTGLSRTITQTYRDQVWVGPSGMLNTPHFTFIREVMGIDRIVFSVDYPYLTMTGARKWLEDLDIPQAEKEAIAFRNAEALLRLG